MAEILIVLALIQLVVLVFMKSVGDSNKEYDDDVATLARGEKWRRDNE